MSIQQLTPGVRAALSVNPNSKIGKIDFRIRMSSRRMDNHAVLDMAIVCKSRTKGIYTIWYGNPQDETGCIVDETYSCNGSSWNDDDLCISVDFDKIPSDIEKMAVITNVLWGRELKQNLGLIDDGYLHVFSHTEEADIIEQHIDWTRHAGKTGIIWLEIYQYKNSWKVKAVENVTNSKNLGELATIASNCL